eukprot:1181061-Karenia_brevis.AAC.1
MNRVMGNLIRCQSLKRSLPSPELLNIVKMDLKVVWVLEIIPDMFIPIVRLNQFKAMSDLEWSAIHDASLPYRPQTKEVTERVGQRVEEGTSTVLVQSGLHGPWWEKLEDIFV